MPLRPTSRARRRRYCRSPRAGASGRGDEDVREPDRGACAPRGARHGRGVADGLRATALLLDELLPSLEREISAVAVPFAYTGRMFVIGRGPEYATAREIALKLLETCRTAAEPLTATDLAHGPVAALDSLFPVWTIASRDDSLPAVVEAAGRVHEAGGTLVATGD